MENTINGYNTAPAPKREEPKENVLAGIVGAFLFALAGGVLWVLLDRVGFYAGISGLVAVVCAIKGYSIFAKKETKRGIIISVIIAALVLVLAWYACLAWDVHNAYKQWYAEGEVDYTLNYFESFRVAYLFLGEKEIARSYIINLVIGLVLCVIGSAGYISSYSKKLKAKQEQKPQQSAADAFGGYTEPLTGPLSANAPSEGETESGSESAYTPWPGEIGSENGNDPYSGDDQN